MKRVTENVVRGLMRPINPTFILILGGYMIVWGLWLISPWWTVFTQAALYSQLAAVAGESIWGTVAVLSGFAAIRGALKPSYQNLRLGTFVAAVFWLVISIMYFVGDWTNTGGITCLALLAYSAAVWVNARVNKAFYERIRK